MIQTDEPGQGLCFSGTEVVKGQSHVCGLENGLCHKLARRTLGQGLILLNLGFLIMLGFGRNKLVEEFQDLAQYLVLTKQPLYLCLREAVWRE